LYGGPEDRFRAPDASKDWPGWSAEIPELWQKFRAELKRLGKRVWKHGISTREQNLINDYLASNEYKIKHNFKRVHTGTRLSYALQNFETEIIQAAISEVQSRGIEVASYQYDGFQVSQEHLPEIEAWIVEQTTGRVRYKIKDFGPALEKPTWQRFDPMAFTFDLGLPHIEGETSEDKEIRLESKIAQIRAKNFSLFEKYVFKSLTPPGYVFLSDGTATIHRDVRPFGTGPQVFANLGVPDVASMGAITQNLFTEWMKRPNLRQYNAMVFKPPPLLCKKGWYNTFRGFKIEETPCSEDQFDPSLFVKHCAIVMEGNATWGEFLLDLFAHRLQRPGERTELGLIVLGPQGSGKTTFFLKFAQAMFYDDNYLVTEKAEQITGKFNQLFEKLLVLWEEAEAKDTSDGADRLKHLLTTDKELIEKKCKDGVAYDMCFLPIVTANNLGSKSVHIEQTDRRYVVTRMGNDHTKDPEYFHNLYGAMSDGKYMRGLFDWLKERDISKYRSGKDWSAARPMTETYRDIQSASRKPVDRWFDSVAEVLSRGGDFGEGEHAGEDKLSLQMKNTFNHGHPTSARDLRHCYASWLKGNGYDKYNITENKFQIELSNLAKGCEGSATAWVKKTKTSGRMVYKFDKAMLVVSRFGPNAAPGDVRAHM